VYACERECVCVCECTYVCERMCVCVFVSVRVCERECLFEGERKGVTHA
jgi:hypothetical protein